MITKLAKLHIQSKTKIESLSQYFLIDNLIRTSDSNQFTHCTSWFLFPTVFRIRPASSNSLFKRRINVPQLDKSLFRTQKNLNDTYGNYSVCKMQIIKTRKNLKA